MNFRIPAGDSVTDLHENAESLVTVDHQRIQRGGDVVRFKQQDSRI
jgi:hypothetical protein